MRSRLAPTKSPPTEGPAIVEAEVNASSTRAARTRDPRSVTSNEEEGQWPPGIRWSGPTELRKLAIVAETPRRRSPRAEQEDHDGHSRSGARTGPGAQRSPPLFAHVDLYGTKDRIPAGDLDYIIRPGNVAARREGNDVVLTYLSMVGHSLEAVGRPAPTLKSSTCTGLTAPRRRWEDVLPSSPWKRLHLSTRPADRDTSGLVRGAQLDRAAVSPLSAARAPVLSQQHSLTLPRRRVASTQPIASEAQAFTGARLDGARQRREVGR